MACSSGFILLLSFENFCCLIVRGKHEHINNNGENDNGDTDVGNPDQVEDIKDTLHNITEQRGNPPDNRSRTLVKIIPGKTYFLLKPAPSLRNRVIASLGKGITSQNSPKSKQAALNDTPYFSTA